MWAGNEQGTWINSTGVTRAEFISETRLKNLHMKAVSQRNFAVLCMRELFSESERRNTNICGHKGKAMLDPSGERLKRIYHYVINMYNVQRDDCMKVWRECQQALNVANLYLNRC